MKPVPKDMVESNVKFHAVLVSSPNFVAVNDPTLILGQVRLQWRQLEKIGYKVHMVSIGRIE